MDGRIGAAHYTLFDQPTATYADAAFYLLAIKLEHRPAVRTFLYGTRERCSWDPATHPDLTWTRWQHERIGTTTTAYDVLGHTGPDFSRILAYTGGYMLVGTASARTTKDDAHKQFLNEAFIYAARRADRALGAGFEAKAE